jgi:hypothetical protein
MKLLSKITLFFKSVANDYSQWVLFGAVLTIFVLQSLTFLTGFRLTADDIAMHLVAMNGLTSVFETAKSYAVAQGRLGHHFMAPILILSNYYIEYNLFKIIVVLTHFLSMAVFSYYISVLFSKTLLYPMLIISCVAIPLGYNHLPPNSYSFLVSLPVLACLASRLILWRQERKCLQLAGVILGVIAALSYEIIFIFLMTVMVLEAVSNRLSSDQSWLSARFTKLAIRRRDLFLVRDIVTLGLAVLIYLVYRILHPSRYEGNVISDLDFSAFVTTTFLQIWQGTFVSAILDQGVPIQKYWQDVLLTKYLFIGLFFISTYIAIIFMLSGRQAPTLRASKLSLIGGLGVFGVICTIVPVAIVQKYQIWCLEYGNCVYVNSRITFYYLSLVLSAFTLAAFLVLKSAVHLPAAYQVIAITFSFLGAANYFHNLVMQKDMQDYVTPWERAKDLVCNPVLGILRDQSYPVIGDSRVSMHPNFNRVAYWDSYMKTVQQSGWCSSIRVRDVDWIPKVRRGVHYKVSVAGSGGNLLYGGWSAPEAWGTWSIGNRSVLMFIRPRDVERVAIVFQPFLARNQHKQIVRIRVNNMLVFDKEITKNELYSELITFPKEVTDNLIVLEFILPDAVSPKEIGLSSDARTLALGLRSLTFD